MTYPQDITPAGAVKTYTARYAKPDHSLTDWITTEQWCFDYAKAHGWHVWQIKRDFNAEGTGRIHVQLYHGA